MTSDITNDLWVSKTFASMRIPLAVFIVFLHAHFHEMTFDGKMMASWEHFPIYATTSFFFSQIICRLSVPLFFLISGYYFFHQVERFSFALYGEKLRKRAKTLFVPYVCWNVIYIGLFFLAETFIPNMRSTATKFVTDYSIEEWLRTFWDLKNGYPINGAMWFIRDLMIIMLASPVIYYAVKYLKIIPLVVLAYCWSSGLWGNSIIPRGSAVLFFTLGAYLSVNEIGFIQLVHSIRYYLLAIFVAVSIVMIVMEAQGHFVYSYRFGLFNILIGAFLTIGLFAHYVKKHEVSLSSCSAGKSFFIYAYHSLPLALCLNIAFKFLLPHTEAELLLIYLLTPSFIAFLGIVFYQAISKYIPRSLSLLTGGR